MNSPSYSAPFSRSFAIAIFLLTIGPSLAAHDSKSAAEVLDRLHESTSQADGETYFALFTKDAVFLGTDASERWTIQEFQRYAAPYFDAGKGWTYTCNTRNINIAPDGQHASFDELLDNASYGVCRGTGVLRLIQGVWKIEQYHLTIPIPNELARDVVAQIRDLEKNAPTP